MFAIKIALKIVRGRFLQIARAIALNLVERLCDLEGRIQYPPAEFVYRPILRLYLWLSNASFAGVICAGPGFRIYGAGTMRLGNYVSFGHSTTISNHGHLEIGENFMGAPHLHINTGTHDPLTLASSPTTVRIGRNNWIGACVTLVEHTSLGDGCVVAAGSVVNGTFESNCLIGGVPARVIRRLPADRSLPSSWANDKRASDVPVKPT